MSRRLALLGLVLLAAGCAKDGNSDPGPGACSSGEAACGDTCVDLRADVSHCGTCGRACEAGDICSAGTCSRPCAGHRFVPLDPFVVGTAGQAATAADADGDGLAELVVADMFNGLVMIPQTSRRVFGTPLTLAEGHGPAAIAAADLDEDGRADLLVGEAYEPRVLSLRNTGEGSFAKRWVEPIRAYAWAYATGDLDGDGHLDIVATAPEEGEVILLQGDGTGEFLFQERAQFTGRPFAPGIGDFDGDGRTDVAFAAGGSSFAVVLYHRDDGYDPELVDAVETLQGLAAGDFDGDGLDDLATAGVSSVAILLGRRQGPFERLAPVDHAWAELAAGDLDGDGLPEVVALGGGRLRVLEVEGAELRVVSEVVVGAGSAKPVLVDLDGDRVLDLVGFRPANPGAGIEGAVLPVYSECD